MLYKVAEFFRRLYGQEHKLNVCKILRFCRTNIQGEIRCFRNSEKLRKPDGSKFRCVSAGRFRRETCIKDENGGIVSCFRSGSASVDLNVSARFHCVSASDFVLKFAGFHDQSLVFHIIKFVLTVLITLQAR